MLVNNRVSSYNNSEVAQIRNFPRYFMYLFHKIRVLKTQP